MAGSEMPAVSAWSVTVTVSILSAVKTTSTFTAPFMPWASAV